MVSPPVHSAHSQVIIELLASKSKTITIAVTIFLVYEDSVFSQLNSNRFHLTVDSCSSYLRFTHSFIDLTSDSPLASSDSFSIISTHVYSFSYHHWFTLSFLIRLYVFVVNGYYIDQECSLFMWGGFATFYSFLSKEIDKKFLYDSPAMSFREILLNDLIMFYQ